MGPRHRRGCLLAMNQHRLVSSEVSFMRRFPFLLLVVAVTAFAAPKVSRDCIKQCDEVLKPMAAECRAAEKGGDKAHKDKDHHPEEPGEAKNMADSCKATLGKMKSACLKECSNEPRRAK
jgi:hypothetical protein